MNVQNCGNCKNFRLHYIKYSRGNYSALSYGHCVKPRLKKRYAEDKACSYWKENKEQRKFTRKRRNVILHKFSAILSRGRRPRRPGDRLKRDVGDAIPREVCANCRFARLP